MEKFCNTSCEALYRMGIPLEKGEWLELGHLMRTITQYSTITDNEKRNIQEKLILAFKGKEFQPDEYSAVIKEIEKIRHIICEEKMDGLEEVIDGMSNVITGLGKQVSNMMKKQANNLSDMSITTRKISDHVKSKRPPAETLSLIGMLEKTCTEMLNNVKTVQKTLEQEATFDPLTKLYNRRSFNSKIRNLIDNFKKNKRPLCLAMIDIDHFKKINDQYGHQVGDQVLAAVSSEIRQNMRDKDYAARYGGEEMTVLFEDIELESAKGRADTIRKNLEQHEFLIRGKSKIVHITVSIGVAQCDPQWADLSAEEIIEKFIGEADKAMYEAKNSGRNRVCP